MSDQEVGRCGFCQSIKPVNRLYLYPSLYKKPEDISERKALHNEGDYFIMVYFCSDCGIPAIPELRRGDDIKSYTPNGDRPRFPKINKEDDIELAKKILMESADKMHWQHRPDFWLRRNAITFTFFTKDSPFHDRFPITVEKRHIHFLMKDDPLISMISLSAGEVLLKNNFIPFKLDEYLEKRFVFRKLPKHVPGFLLWGKSDNENVYIVPKSDSNGELRKPFRNYEGPIEHYYDAENQPEFNTYKWAEMEKPKYKGLITEDFKNYSDDYFKRYPKINNPDTFTKKDDVVPPTNKPGKDATPFNIKLDQSWFPKINANINKPLHRSIITRLRMWWARQFQTISENQANAWGLKEDHKVYGDIRNRYNSVWIDEKGREYLIK